MSDYDPIDDASAEPVIKLPKKLLFAIEAVVDIAYNAGDAPVQSGEITRRQGIPRRYLEQVLQQLVRARILDGVRGPRGGYRLARERRRISVADIARVVRSTERDTGARAADTGSGLNQRVVRPMWAEVEAALIARLEAITVEELCLRAHRGGIESEASERLDYSI